MKIIFLFLWCAVSLVSTIVFSARAAIIWRTDDKEHTFLVLVAFFLGLHFVAALRAILQLPPSA